MDMPIRWGLLSTAKINRALIPALRGSKRSLLLAVASRTREAAESYAREWKIPRAYASYEALLADPEIDVIYIPLPNHLHAAWTINALEAGKHVLCEKPLALSAEDVEAIADSANKNNRVAAEAFMYRYHPQTLKVKELIDGGAIGRLQTIRSGFSFNLNRTGDIRLDPAAGGGSIWDVGCYPISYARYIAGSEPLEVFGWQVTGGTGVDETFIGQMRFKNGVHAQFDSGFRSPLRWHLEVVGADGTLTVPSPFKPGVNEKILLTRNGITETIRIRGRELYTGEIDDLTDAALNGTPPRVSLVDSRGNVAAINALRESARTGRPVLLN